MKKFENVLELYKATEIGNVGVAVNITQPYSTIIANIEFVLFKIKELTLNSYYYGDMVFCSYLEQKNSKKMEIDVQKNHLILWKDKREKVEITSISFDEFDHPKFCLLEKDDNPEEFFQEIMKLENTSGNILEMFKLIEEKIQ